MSAEGSVRLIKTQTVINWHGQQVTKNTVMDAWFGLHDALLEIEAFNRYASIIDFDRVQTRHPLKFDDYEHPERFHLTSIAFSRRVNDGIGGASEAILFDLYLAEM